MIGSGGAQRAVFLGGWAWVVANTAAQFGTPPDIKPPPKRPIIFASPQADPTQRAALIFRHPPGSTAAPATTTVPAWGLKFGSQRSAFSAGSARLFRPASFASVVPSAFTPVTRIQARPQQFGETPQPLLFRQDHSLQLLPAANLLWRVQDSKEFPFARVFTPFLGPSALRLPPPTKPLLAAAPQTDPSQRAALLWHAPPPVTPPPLRPTFYATPQITLYQVAPKLFGQYLLPSVTPLPGADVISIVELQAKYIGTAFIVDFDFISHLEAGRSLVGGSIACTVFSGVDAAPQEVLVGSAYAYHATSLRQEVILSGGLPGVIYKLVATATDSSGDEHQLQGLLALLPAAAS